MTDYGYVLPSKPSPFCGRLDPHPEHDWTSESRYHRVTYHCPGPPVTEGGRPCTSCRGPVANCDCETKETTR